MPERGGGRASGPWWFVPTLYFAEGLPYIIINTVSVILYKRLGLDNGRIAFWTSWLYLPWVIKMLWGPAVDMRSTKRSWILATQAAMAACLGGAALSLGLPWFFAVSLLFFVAGAFVSATHDVAADGFYMLALSERDQALFVGFRSAFYRLAMIFGSGGLVYFAGRLEDATNNVSASWSAVLAAAAALFAGLAVYHRFVLPRPAGDGAAGSARAEAAFLEIILSYFRQEKIGATLAFIMLYRFSEAMLFKLAPPFLLDGRDAGGMGLSTSEVGVVYGTVGIAALVLGGILGGWIMSRYGFRRCIWPFAVILNVPNLFYLYLACAQPPVWTTGFLVAAEQFGYGVGFTAFTVYLIHRAAESPHKTSNYAISTGIMALGMMLPGFVSGYIQQAIGYRGFFGVVCAASIPGMLVIPFIPKEPRSA